MRRRALDQIFGNLRKGSQGRHRTNDERGQGDEPSEDRRPYRFGDKLDQVDFGASLAQRSDSPRSRRCTEWPWSGLSTDRRRPGGGRPRVHRSTTATVLMIDISHSMILYGEDRITPAKKVAMALAELVMVKYPKDTLDIVVFGDDAWESAHRRTCPTCRWAPSTPTRSQGLERAMDILRRRKTPNRQIFMVTDGKPSCLKEARRLLQKQLWARTPTSRGNATTSPASAASWASPSPPFMIATDPALQRFVSDFTEANGWPGLFYGPCRALATPFSPTSNATAAGAPAEYDAPSMSTPSTRQSATLGRPPRLGLCPPDPLPTELRANLVVAPLIQAPPCSRASSGTTTQSFPRCSAPFWPVTA